MDELLKQLNDINEDLEDDAFEAPTNEEMPVENVDLSVRAQEKKITWTLKKNDAVRFHKILEFINSNPNVHFMLAGDGTERKDALTRLNQLGPDERIKIAINYRNPQGLNNKCFYFLDMIVGPLLFGDDKGSKLNPVLPTDPELRVIRNFLMDLKLPHAELVFETLDRLYEDFDDDCFETSEPYIPLVEIIYDYPNIVGCEIKNSKGKKGTIEKQSNSQLWVHWEGNKNYSTINISYPDRLGGYMIRKHRINEDTEDTNDMFDAAELPNENAGKEGSSEHMAKIKKLLEDKGWEVQHMATLYPKRDCVEWYDVGTRLFDLKRGNIIFHFYVSGNGLHITLPNGEDAKTLALVFTRGYRSGNNVESGSENMVYDFGQYLYDRTVTYWNRNRNNALHSYGLYGENIVFRSYRICPLINFMPMKIVGKTNTIGTQNRIKNVSGKNYHITFGNITPFGKGSSDGKPPGVLN